MSAAAKAFNPFAAGAVTAQAKEFRMPTQTEPQQPPSAQAGIISMLSRMGIEAQVDPEVGTILI